MTTKRINVQQLKKGMYIHDLNRKWMKHPFLFNKFLIKNEDMVRKIVRSGSKDIFIDISKGLDVEEVKPKEPQEVEVRSRIIAASKDKEQPKSVSKLKKEINKAKTIHQDAVHVVHSLMTDIRLGKQVDVEKTEPLVKQIAESIIRDNDALIILSQIKQKDAYTFQHSVSVCALLVSFLRALGYDKDEIREAGIGALLHDIGKMVIPEDILNKPGALTNDEFSAMKKHVANGVDFLRDNPRISTTAIQVVSQHHERFDGSGYPNRLSGNNISRFGQMAAIVDVYDAISSDRVYRSAMPPAEALQKLTEWSKTHFNPTLVQHFILAIGIYPVGSLVRLESDKLAVVCQQHPEDLLYPIVRVMFDIKTESEITPEYIDLSKPLAGGSSDRIVGYENPQTWGVNPMLYLEH